MRAFKPIERLVPVS